MSRGLVRELVRLGWPVLVAQLAVMANSVIDTIMAGRYGTLALAAVGIGSSIYISAFVALMGVLLAAALALIALGCAAAVGACLYLFADGIAGLYTGDAGLRRRRRARGLSAFFRVRRDPGRRRGYSQRCIE